MRLAAAAVVLLAVLPLSACSDEAQRAADDALASASAKASEGVDKAKDELAKVDWDKYGTELKQRLDRLAEKADCTSLQNELSTVEENDLALTRYIKRLIAKADCPGS